MQSKQGSEKRGTVSWQGLWMKLRHSEQIMVKQDVPHAGQGCKDKHRLIVALDGSGSIEIDASCYPVKEGEAWLLLPGQSCSFYIESSRKLTCHALAFDVYREAESEDGEAITLHRTTLPFAGRVTCLSQPTLRMRCGSIGEAWEQTDARSRFRAQTQLQELMYELLPDSQCAASEDSLETLEQTRLYLDGHYQESWTIEKLAAMAGLSPSYAPWIT
ncbi:hypothetical protein [Brevibacillus agri]|uniref:hypothetical protein n=1 Tax=Brevibacillus agri TaxID=51101 RepID=UPI001EE5F880|nr:hypothetical protein [Brevibacillus agri]MCG5253401.1 hypothetical protein [Brevibacillus agri]